MYLYYIRFQIHQLFNEYKKTKRLNCSFNPLTFTKLRFWPPKKKKLQNGPLSFASVAVLAPQGQKKNT